MNKKVPKASMLHDEEEMKKFDPIGNDIRQSLRVEPK
jgi:hypothetical protein